MLFLWLGTNVLALKLVSACPTASILWHCMSFLRACKYECDLVMLGCRWHLCDGTRQLLADWLSYGWSNGSHDLTVADNGPCLRHKMGGNLYGACIIAFCRSRQHEFILLLLLISIDELWAWECPTGTLIIITKGKVRLAATVPSRACCTCLSVSRVQLQSHQLFSLSAITLMTASVVDRVWGTAYTCTHGYNRV